MARINRSECPTPTSFTAMHEQTTLHGENNDCVVKALAMAGRMPYVKALAICAKAGRKKGQGMYTRDWLPLFEEHGVKLVERCKEDFIQQYPGVHATALSNITTHHPDRFNKVWRDGRRYLFLCSRHVAYVENGECQDWTRGRATRVVTVYEIVEPK